MKIICSVQKSKEIYKKIAKNMTQLELKELFMTFDDRPAIISGGDYGWKTDIEKQQQNCLNI